MLENYQIAQATHKHLNYNLFLRFKIYIKILMQLFIEIKLIDLEY